MDGKERIIDLYGQFCKQDMHAAAATLVLAVVLEDFRREVKEAVEELTAALKTKKQDHFV